MSWPPVFVRKRQITATIRKIRVPKPSVVYNYSIPRARVVKIIKRPIYVAKVYKVDKLERWPV